MKGNSLQTDRSQSPSRSNSLPALLGDMFPSFFNFGSDYWPKPAGFVPDVDVVESNEEYKLRLDLPGTTQDQVNIQLADNVLTIQGERGCEETKEGDRWHVFERCRGQFARSIRFPTPVEANSVKATMKNGVLSITVPKSEGARTQKIKIAES